jgi:hypothetical protein
MHQAPKPQLLNGINLLLWGRGGEWGDDFQLEVRVAARILL